MNPESARPGLSEMEQSIRQGIERRTSGQIQSLQVEVNGREIVVEGHASCFYHKQLALQGVFEAIGNQSGKRIKLDIDVVTRAQNPADVEVAAPYEGLE